MMIIKTTVHAPLLHVHCFGGDVLLRPLWLLIDCAPAAASLVNLSSFRFDSLKNRPHAVEDLLPIIILTAVPCTPIMVKVKTRVG